MTYDGPNNDFCSCGIRPRISSSWVLRKAIREKMVLHWQKFHSYNEGRLTDREIKSSPYTKPWIVTRKPVPTRTIVANQNSDTTNSEKRLLEHEKYNRERKWSSKPRRLKEWTAFTRVALCWDLFLTLLTVFFICKLATNVLYRLC